MYVPRSHLRYKSKVMGIRPKVPSHINISSHLPLAPSTILFSWALASSCSKPIDSLFTIPELPAPAGRYGAGRTGAGLPDIRRSEAGLYGAGRTGTVRPESAG